MSRAQWNDDGHPQNVEAAIADALDWMRLLHRRVEASGRPENARRLRHAMHELAAYGDPKDVAHQNAVYPIEP